MSALTLVTGWEKLRASPPGPAASPSPARGQAISRISSDRHIAIVGAGGLGSCAALELAARGHRVALFEKGAQAVSQASYVNEGKIHLGFIYAKDRSLRTAAWMIEGALEFEAGLQRWLPFRARGVASTPFYYAVHRGSLLGADALAAHYARCRALYRERSQAKRLDYLGLGTGCAFSRLERAEFAELVDPTYYSAVFRTTEHAVDPRAIAAELRSALAAESRIDLRSRHSVVGVRPHGRNLRLTLHHDGSEFGEDFTDVVNASWYERLPVDRDMGIAPPAAWSHRYKFGNRVHVPLRADQVPSVTSVQGPFGDIVNFGERGLFLSWYPTGRTGMSADEVPPDWHDSYEPRQRHAVFRSSLTELQKRCSRLEGLPIDLDRVDPNGGVIYALGTTDVDDAGSKLHDRFEIGIQTRGRYHSVDTGKYTLVPYWATRVADRVEACGA